MSTTTTPLAGSDADTTLARPALPVILALFCGYLAVGLPLPVLPLFIHEHLGFGSATVGMVIGIQFLATVLSRGYAGRVTDQQGGKHAALQGALFAAMGGALYWCAAQPALSPATSLALVVLGRLACGVGESQFVTGCVAWSMASVGPKRAGLSMSWTGMAMFAALAAGAPLGMALYRKFGLATLMLACIAAPLLAFAIARGARAWLSPAGNRLPFHRVIGQIWREGAALALQGAGLAGLTAFASLYFASHHWEHAGWVMTAFGISFIAVRLVLGHLPDRLGGYHVAAWSLLVEAIGQALLWLGHTETLALAGALLTGLGCALVFPALGVEAIQRVPPANRGSAMGAFVAFLDIAYGVAEPASGTLAGRFGYSSVYLFGGVCALLGMVIALLSRTTATTDAHSR